MMEEEKDILLDAWSRLKRFVYNYPLLWFLIGFLLAFILFPLQLFSTYHNPFRSLLTFIIIFSFSIINIAVNYDKNRSKFKWLFWDCLASIYLLCCSFIYFMSFFDFENNAWLYFVFPNIDGMMWLCLRFVEELLKDYSFYTPFVSEEFNYFLYYINSFESFDVFFIFTSIFVGITIYDFYKKKTIKEILRTRCFFMLVMLSLSRCLFFMAIVLQ